MRRSLLRCAHCALLPCCRGAAWLRFEREVLTEPESAASSSRCSPRGTQAGRCYCFRSFGFEFQGPCSAFTSWRARKRDPKTFSLPAHNQKLVLGHVTFVLQQLCFSKSALNAASASTIASKDFFTAAGKSSASMFCHFNSSRA